MVRFGLIAAGAGVVSALLYLSVVLGQPSAMLLAYLAQLPLFAVWLGMGGMAGVTATGSATLVVGLLGGAIAGGLFLLVSGVPVIVVGRKALLSRTDPDGKTEWYPLGLLVSWLVGMGAGSFVVAGIVLMLSTEGVEASIRSFLGLGIERLMASAAEADRPRRLRACSRVSGATCDRAPSSPTSSCRIC
jgi:hypothetical protein